ncbi:MAG: aminopeptidase P N-terminal domain-containing protein [Gammaproteobacteria bacterium]|nr:aminopeptidase P N-terminal domain-containing protein [Gammaproteobacteria bacterium]
MSPAEYHRRRQKLMSMMECGTVALLPAAPARIRNRDTEYLYRQDSDFFYLTGFSEPDAVLVLAPGREQGEIVLFCRDRDERVERYEGERIGPDRATQMLNVDDALSINDLDEFLPGMLEGSERIYVTLGEYPEFDNKLINWVSTIRRREAGGVVAPGEFVALKHLLHEQRLYKSSAEIRLMREAAEITCQAHIRAMTSCRPGMSESDLEAELVYVFMRNGARTPAYPCIVGGGENACTLHYVENSATLRKNDLVLIDAGCEYQHYAADVTRTFPVGGVFNKTQQALYEVVLEANKQGITRCTSGVRFREPHEVALKVLVEGLVELKLLEGDVDEIIAEESYRQFCPHTSSHWLGSDVHDVGDYRVDGAWRELQPGMVLTMEPGIYIPDNEAMAHLAPRWRGMGIRIEDDVLVTRQQPDVLSSAAPKEIPDIQRVMADGVSG